MIKVGQNLFGKKIKNLNQFIAKIQWENVYMDLPNELKCKIVNSPSMQDLHFFCSVFFSQLHLYKHTNRKCRKRIIQRESNLSLINHYYIA